MTEFRGVLRLKSGSMDQFGNILCVNGFGEGKIACDGYVEINVPVNLHRWAAYIELGWEARCQHLDFTTNEATGLLYRRQRKPGSWIDGVLLAELGLEPR